jgi:ADP-ribosyl-[dinitrogen reductase] hydrolase
MLVELAIGDAYGAGFEYADRLFVRQYNDLSGYVKHPRHALKPGCYTDDTQMSLAIAELIIYDLPWNPETIAEKFVEVFKRDPRQGYSNRFYMFLKKVRNGQAFLDDIDPTSDKSGAAMRAAPLGVFSSIAEVTEKCAIQAKLTHNTPDGIHAAVAAALLAHYFVYRLGPKAEVGYFLEQHAPGQWSEPWKGEVRSKGWMSVRAAVTALVRSDRLSVLLRNCVAFTGDVDTVAAIAMAAGAHSEEIVSDIPACLAKKLENRTFGRQYLLALDAQLMSKVGIKR